MLGCLPRWYSCCRRCCCPPNTSSSSVASCSIVGGIFARAVFVVGGHVCAPFTASAASLSTSQTRACVRPFLWHSQFYCRIMIRFSRTQKGPSFRISRRHCVCVCFFASIQIYKLWHDNNLAIDVTARTATMATLEKDLLLDDVIMDLTANTLEGPPEPCLSL